VDNSPTEQAPETRWSPKPALVGLGWAVTVLVAIGAVLDGFSGDHGGIVLFSLAALAVGAFTVHATFVRPRLAADLTGISARTLSGTVKLDWPSTRVRLRTTRRLGRDGITLEVEAEDVLLIFGRLELGEDPHDVLDVLSALRARS
jgi:hypothetical protein